MEDVGRVSTTDELATHSSVAPTIFPLIRLSTSDLQPKMARKGLVHQSDRWAQPIGWIPVLELLVLNLPDYNPASEERAADYRTGQFALVIEQLDDDAAAERVA